MWTFRLRIQLKDGSRLALFGAEEKLRSFRDGLQALVESGADDIVPYVNHAQTEFVPVDRIERIGEPEPVIPTTFLPGDSG